MATKLDRTGWKIDDSQVGVATVEMELLVQAALAETPVEEREHVWVRSVQEVYAGFVVVVECAAAGKAYWTSDKDDAKIKLDDDGAIATEYEVEPEVTSIAAFISEAGFTDDEGGNLVLVDEEVQRIVVARYTDRA